MPPSKDTTRDIFVSNSLRLLGDLCDLAVQMRADISLKTVPFLPGPDFRVSDIIKGKRSITAETALAFSLFFGNSPQFWLNLQSHFDLEKATRSSFEKIKTRVKPLQAA